MLKLFTNIYSKQSHGNVLLFYNGVVSDTRIDLLFAMCEHSLKLQQESLITKKRLCYILMECLQNIYHHSEKLNRQIEAKLLISKANDAYHLFIANPVKKELKSSISMKIDAVNKNEDLSQLYREVLNNNEMSDKGGSGLGFIDFARKAAKPLQFHFCDIDKHYSLFILEIKILRIIQ
jgi:hypothetical protein